MALNKPYYIIAFNTQFRIAANNDIGTYQSFQIFAQKGAREAKCTSRKCNALYNYPSFYGKRLLTTKKQHSPAERALS